MNPFKIVGWVGLAIAIIGAFVPEFEYANPILVLLGLVGGVAIATEDHVRVLVSALVLTALSGVLTHIPAVGSYLSGIFGYIGVFAAGASIMIISRNIWRRYKP